MSGLLNKALEVLPRIFRHGLTETASMREAREDFTKVTDPLSVWLDRHVVEASGALLPKQNLLAAYRIACEHEGRPGPTEQSFGRAIKRHYPGIGDAQRTVDGEVKRVWIGLDLKRSTSAP